MCDTCNDNRFELIEKYKQRLLDATNIGDSPEEMAVIDNILFRFWQMGWLNLATDTISRQDAITLLEEAESARLRGDILLFYPVMLNGLKKLPSAQPVAKDINVPVKDCIGREVAIETVRKVKSIGQAHRMLMQLPSTQPGCEDAVPRTAVEYICRKNTVSTNPYEHKYHDKFIQFMDDPAISDFGRWQHSNGFNTALVAVKCDLDKVPSVTPKPWKGEEHG